MNIYNETKFINNYVLKLAHHFHKFPELANQEYHTHLKIIDELKKMKINYEIIDDFNILAYINKNSNGPCIALRTEIDALPIQENNNLAFKSVNKGISHTCGHDYHMAIMLGIINILKDKNIKGKIIFIFEQGTETNTGSQKILNSGKLDRVDYIFALHNLPTLNINEIGLKDGLFLLGCDTININFHGKAQHSALPTKSIELIGSAANLITTFQGIVNKSVDSTKITYLNFTKVIAGNTTNVTASKAELFLDFRYENNQIQKRVYEILKRVLASHKHDYEVEINYHISSTTPALINDSKAYQIAYKAIDENKDILKYIELDKLIFSSSFAVYLKKIKGCFAYYGSKIEDNNYNIHHENYLYNEKAISSALIYYLQILNDLLIIK
ncbi:MAG: amidohydrolase [Bacilli bacterium]|jgi:amidohydrolase|nr:amidohydrolase [Bacilli bacterium]